MRSPVAHVTGWNKMTLLRLVIWQVYLKGRNLREKGCLLRACKSLLYCMCHFCKFTIVCWIKWLDFNLSRGWRSWGQGKATSEWSCFYELVTGFVKLLISSLGSNNRFCRGSSLICRPVQLGSSLLCVISMHLKIKKFILSEAFAMGLVLTILNTCSLKVIWKAGFKWKKILLCQKSNLADSQHISRSGLAISPGNAAACSVSDRS